MNTFSRYRDILLSQFAPSLDMTLPACSNTRFARLVDRAPDALCVNYTMLFQWA